MVQLWVTNCSHNPLKASLPYYTRTCGVGNLPKKHVFICPCGFYLETLNRNDAIVLIQLHVQQHHADHLPFGITQTEAEVFLKRMQTPKPRGKVDNRRILIH